MTSERVIKKAPVPVLWRWSQLDGVPMKNYPVWFYNDPVDESCRFVARCDVMTIEYDNGQTVIVRAKP